jgi:cytoskeletal protein CcmA (bactofilin family)
MFDKRKDANQDGPRAHYESGLNDLSASQAQSPERPQTSGRAAVIGPRIKINGDVTGEENLVIEGEVNGSVDLKQYRVDVGPSGRVKADIDAKVVKVDGTVQGDIVASEMATISRTGNVRGNITAPRMTLEDGAKFKGSIDMDPDDASKGSARSPARAESKPADAKGKDDDAGSADKKAAGNGAAPVTDKSKAEQGLPLKG